MDLRIRELERLADSGDIEAQQALKQHWIRYQLVPSDDDILLMRCGYAQGNQHSVPFFVGLWKHILSTLIDSISNYWAQLAAGANAPDDEFHSIEENRLFFQKELMFNIGDYLAPNPEIPDLISFLHLKFENILEFINGALEDRDTAPIYVNYNDLTDSLTLAYLDPNHRIPVKLYTTLRSFKHFPAYFNEKRRSLNGAYEVDIYWNAGSAFDSNQLAYKAPETREEICQNSFFLNLPCALQDYPVWKSWAYGECANVSFNYGIYYYMPIQDDLASLRWLKI